LKYDQTSAVEWLVKNWEALGDFHAILEFVSAFSPNNPDRITIVRRCDADLLTLWNYAQQALLTVLLRKRTKAQLSAKMVRDQQATLIELLRVYAPATRDHLLCTLEEYFSKLEFCYLGWVKENPAGNIKDFLAQAPVFTLSSARGGPRKEADDKRSAEVALYFRAFHLVLKQKLKKSYYNPLVGERDVKAALRETLGTTFDEVLREQLNRWVSLPLRQLALEVTAWKYDIEPSYVEKHSAQVFKKNVLALLANLRRKLMLPVVQDIHQKLRDIRTAALS
jgi:hypothetical protein